MIARLVWDPAAAIRALAARPRPYRVAGVILAAVTLLGLATLPRQLPLLADLLAPGSAPWGDAAERLRAGVTRLLVADRLLPPATPVLGAALLFGLAEPVLALPRDRRAALVALLVAGLAPLLALRAGELAVVWLTPPDAIPTAGHALELPRRFATGPRLLWRPDHPPGWLPVLDARLNLILLWCAVLWALGLRELDGGRLAAWHLTLPLAALAVAGLLTWALTPLLLPLVLVG